MIPKVTEGRFSMRVLKVFGVDSIFVTQMYIPKVTPLKNSTDLPVELCLSKASWIDFRVVRAEAKLSPYRRTPACYKLLEGRRVKSFLKKSRDLILGNLIHE